MHDAADEGPEHGEVARRAAARQNTHERIVIEAQPARPGQDSTTAAEHREQVGVDAVLHFLRNGLNGRGMVECGGRLQLWDVGDEPPLLHEVQKLTLTEQIHERRGFGKPALQVALRLPRDRVRHPVNRDAHRHDHEHRAGQKDPVGQRGERPHGSEPI